jgi:hypothetical protein
MAEVFLNSIEKKLLNEGYDSFTLQDKNNLITFIANKEQVTYSTITDEYVLDYHKKLKTDILSETCDELIVGGFTATNGNHYRTNRDDQLNFVAKNVQLLHNTSIQTIMWKTENKGYVEHTREEWLQVYDEALAHKETKLFKYNNLKFEVANAKTDAEVLAVSFE